MNAYESSFSYSDTSEYRDNWRISDTGQSQQASFWRSRIGQFIFKSAIRSHHVLTATLFVLTFDVMLRLVIACYGLTIGLVYLALRMTRERNLRYQSS